MVRGTPLALAGFFAMATLVCLVTAVTLVLPHGPFSGIWGVKPAEYETMLALGRWIGGAFAALAGVMAAAAWGCAGRRRWGWALAVGIFALNMLSDLGRVVRGDLVDRATGIVVVGLILLWVLRAPVRAEFSR